DLKTIERLRAAGVPVIVVLVSGRPLDVAAELPGWDALLAAWLPGTEGAGVADVLFGDVEPTGRLPVTWMRDADQQPINRGGGTTPLFPFGYGLGSDWHRPSGVEAGGLLRRQGGVEGPALVEQVVGGRDGGGEAVFVRARHGDV